MIGYATIGRAVLFGAGLLLAACGGAVQDGHPGSPPQLTAVHPQGLAERIPQPTFYGLYAVSGTQLVRLDGDPDWEVESWPQRSDLPSDTLFVIFDPSLGSGTTPLRERVQLRHVARVRNSVSLATATVRPLETDEWVAPDLPPFRVVLDFRPIDQRPDMMLAIPRAALDGGLYELQLRHEATDTTARIGIGWSSVDHARYAVNYCVDRYQGADFPFGLCGLAAR